MSKRLGSNPLESEQADADFVKDLEIFKMKTGEKPSSTLVQTSQPTHIKPMDRYAARLEHKKKMENLKWARREARREKRKKS